MMNCNSQSANFQTRCVLPTPPVPRPSPSLNPAPILNRYGERGLPFGLHFDSIKLSNWLRPLSLNNRSMIDNKGNRVVPSQMRLVPRRRSGAAEAATRVPSFLKLNVLPKKIGKDKQRGRKEANGSSLSVLIF
jgi:hypothetical protein